MANYLHFLQAFFACLTVLGLLNLMGDFLFDGHGSLRNTITKSQLRFACLCTPTCLPSGFVKLNVL